MRLLDEKGKIFGLINVIDAVILLVILMLAGGAAYKFLRPAAVTPPTGIEFTVRIPALPPESASVVKVGDRMVAGASYIGLTVKDVTVEPALTTEPDAAGQKVLARDPYFKDLLVTLEGKVPIPTAQIKISTQEVRVGRDYFVKSLTYEFRGTIIKVTLNPRTDKTGR
ncbi:MAG: DUF4330 domain-containing protein [Ammonifex sp.]|jgi:hypothetical protein|nr:MAG: DUF4330 domain-containing protein [Ammonifex sp.]